MIINIKTESGAEVSAPTEKWVVALLITLSDTHPEVFEKVLRKVDGSVDAYASIPKSVQRSLIKS